MKKWMRLTELLRKTKKTGNIPQIFINYVPEHGKITFLSERTGYKFDQAAETEPLGWNPFITPYGKIGIVASHVTDFTFTLAGDVAHYNGPQLLKEYGEQLYSNKKLKAIGGALTQETLEFLPQNLKELKRPLHTYWIASTRPRIERNDMCYSMLYASSSGNIFSQYLYEEDKHCTCSPKYSLRPIVYLSNNTMICIEDGYYDGSTIERPLKIGLLLERSNEYYEHTQNVLSSPITQEERHIGAKNITHFIF